MTPSYFVSPSANVGQFDIRERAFVAGPEGRTVKLELLVDTCESFAIAKAKLQYIIAQAKLKGGAVA
ncbi:hypothetical protein ACQR3P_28675 [Rhodococcus sp. IEGM1300]